MNRYVFYLAIRPPALSRVQCGVLTRSCELRATVIRTMPSFDPSPMESGDRRNRCTCAVVCRYSRWSCIVYAPPPPFCLLVQRSVKVLVKLSRSRFMLEVRGDKDIQRTERAWARTPGGSLVSAVRRTRRVGVKLVALIHYWFIMSSCDFSNIRIV